MGSRVFDGVDDAATCGDTASMRTPTTAVSIGCWFKVSATTEAFAWVIGKQVNAGADPFMSWGFIQDGSTVGGLKFWVSDGTSTSSVTGVTSGLSTDTWYYAACRWQSGSLLELRVYNQDGSTNQTVASGSTYSTTITYADNFLRFGHDQSPNSWGGKLAHAFVDDSYLSFTDFEAILPVGDPQGTITPSVGYWPLNAGDSPEPDEINGNDLTLSGTTFDAADDPLSAAETQIVRPVSTTNAGTWTAVGAASLHEAVDEETATFDDYIHSEEDPTDSPVVLRLGPLAQPASAPANDEVVVHVQYDREGGTATTNLTLELRQGYTNEGSPGTLIASTSDSGVTDATEDGTISLTAAEAANITYTGGLASNLDVRIVADLT